MDLDDLDPAKRPAMAFALEDLTSYSIGELEQRITVLKAEIDRCEQLIESKQGTRAAADGFFKRP